MMTAVMPTTEQLRDAVQCWAADGTNKRQRAARHHLGMAMVEAYVAASRACDTELAVRAVDTLARLLGQVDEPLPEGTTLARRWTEVVADADLLTVSDAADIEALAKLRAAEIVAAIRGGRPLVGRG